MGGALDQTTLEDLFVRLERSLYNVVYRWLWSVEDSREVVQEAFMRLWRMRERVEIETVEPLVYKIALNLAASRRRTHRIWRWVSLEALREEPVDSRGADELAATAQETARLRAAVESLPESLRRVVFLCELSELSYEEVGRALSIPVGTVGSRRHRALPGSRHPAGLHALGRPSVQPRRPCSGRKARPGRATAAVWRIAQQRRRPPLHESRRSCRIPTIRLSP